MGVTGLWQIVQPCARPIKIETLNRKRLAVDASIWIYQFLKAVRDKEGNALRNSHVVGFFRRICKLLFFGIKPVFVFDGGAPALKRQTITRRKQRREGRRDDAVRTAGRMLAVQMQRRAEEDEQRRREARDGRGQEEEAVPDEGLVYVDELQMTQQERQQNRKFRKKDAYHLPEMEIGMHEMGGPNDPRVMSLEELEAYARQFDTGEDINVYDFSKIDYDSPFFMSLPASDRYNILNAARLRSRLRMGHSKEQLDSMFPDRMAFSRFQIDRVRERNELTTRLMNINDGDVKYTGAGNRVAGERAREYVLVRNEGVEGGYALCVISDEGTKRETAIDIDKQVAAKVESSEDEDEEFEDVPIEGLNRLPKRRKLDADDDSAAARQRRGGYASRRSMGETYARRKATRKPQLAPVVPDDPDSLFVADEPDEVDQSEEEWEEVEGNEELFGDSHDVEDDENEDLRRAIAMSLDSNDGNGLGEGPAPEADAEESEDWYASFQQQKAAESRPVPKGSARAIANILNKRANAAAPDSHETTSFGVPVPKPDTLGAPFDDSNEDDDTTDFQVAFAESRRGKRKATPPPARDSGASQAKVGTSQRSTNATSATKASPKKANTGPLPFETLDLGSSLLGKKKMQQRTEEAEGGFERADDAEKRAARKEPLPPWFSGNLEEDMAKQDKLERADRERVRKAAKEFQFQSREGESLLSMKARPSEIIDLDANDDDVSTSKKKPKDIIDLEDDDDGGDGLIAVAPELTGKPLDAKIRMGDMANAVTIEPPVPEQPPNKENQKPSSLLSESDAASVKGTKQIPERVQRPVTMTTTTPHRKANGPFSTDDSDKEPLHIASAQPSEAAVPQDADLEAEEFEWSDSDDRHQEGQFIRDGERFSADSEMIPQVHNYSELEFEDVVPEKRSPPPFNPSKSRSASPEFEDVDLSKRPTPTTRSSPPAGLPLLEEDQGSPIPATGLARQDTLPEDDEHEFDDFSDPEEEELLKALTLEAEEHARFASTLNQKSAAQNIAEYEKELKQLRNQQKKDRRDADEVTHIMVTECQQLLRLFGLPYVTAPMEAEAQCAELVTLGLVDGIVTDDSDCFLFGGTRIYKNMFNQAKFVECYLASDLQKEFDLTREKMIAVAQLLGSDYTEGLSGVGPVMALEILGEFPGGLPEFRDWFNGVQLQSIPKEADKGNAFRKKFRKQATKIILPPSFPDPRVEMAYKEPEVDSDPAPFQWGVPDLDALRSFLMATIGWSHERTDEVLVPVIKDMNRRADEGTQANITAFFEGGVGVGAAGVAVNGKGEGFAPRRRDQGSKRMGKALGKMAERAKIQRTLGRDGEVQSNRQERVNMQDVDVPEEDITMSATTGRKGKKRATASESAAESEDVSEFGAAKKNPKRKGTASGRDKGASRGRRRRNTAEDAELET